MTDIGRSPDGSGYSAEPESSSTVSAVPVSIPNADTLTEADKEAAREQLVAIFRAAISAAYATQVRRGFTVEIMARRVGWKRAKMERLLLVPRDIRLDEIATVCFAMQCEPEFGSDSLNRIVIGVRPWPTGYASAIEARSDATGTGAAEGESAVPNGETPK